MGESVGVGPLLCAAVGHAEEAVNNLASIIVCYCGGRYAGEGLGGEPQA